MQKNVFLPLVTQLYNDLLSSFGSFKAVARHSVVGHDIRFLRFMSGHLSGETHYHTRVRFHHLHQGLSLEFGKLNRGLKTCIDMIVTRGHLSFMSDLLCLLHPSCLSSLLLEIFSKV